jgi:uncharacterized protein YbjT (DUF2867 family)
MMRTALVVGATGLTGGHCLELLLNDDAYDKVTVLARRTLSTTHRKLTQYRVDFDNLNDAAALITADDVFCCLGTTIKKAGSKDAFRKVDKVYPAELARLASANGCKQFLVISAPEASPHSPFFYGRVKAEMEQAISAYVFTQGTYIFRPSLLIGERDEARFGESLAIKAFTTVPFLFAGPLKKLRPIDAKAVAGAMIITAKSAPGGKQSFASSIIQAIYDAGKMVPGSV